MKQFPCPSMQRTISCQNKEFAISAGGTVMFHGGGTRLISSLVKQRCALLPPCIQCVLHSLQAMFRIDSLVDDKRTELGSIRVQWLLEQAVPLLSRKWLRFYTDSEGNDVMLILQHPLQREWAFRFGRGEPLLMDATHGVNRHGLKLITLHVFDGSLKGRVFRI